MQFHESFCMHYIGVKKINPDVRPILISFLSNDRVKTRADLNANIQSKFLKKDKQGMANSY